MFNGFDERLMLSRYVVDAADVSEVYTYQVAVKAD
jgi:hypothetical protein